LEHARVLSGRCVESAVGLAGSKQSVSASMLMQDMADAAGRAAAADVLSSLLRCPGLWGPAADGAAAEAAGVGAFDGGAWGEALSELAAKARTNSLRVF